jgi:cell division protein FtsL
VARLNLLLLALLTVCALGLVTSQHKARKLFAELERQQARTKALDVEWGQLELETRTWALPSRVDKLARERLDMRAPDPRRIHVLRREQAARTVEDR